MALSGILITIVAIGVAAAVYAYVGFPALATVLGAVCPRGRAVIDRRREPRDVTVVISAYNEEQSLEAKIRNVLATDYPRELLDVLIVSDASTDRTNEIARSFRRERVKLLVEPVRNGKSMGLNHAMEVVRGHIVVFTDANASFEPDTIPKLVRYFADPVVGLVTGYTRYETRGAGEVAKVTNLYTSLERAIKTAESRWGCCVGADGAVFAMRRRLFRPLRHDDINDFVIPLDVIMQGAECVFAVDAACAEPTGSSVGSEFRRQARITNRTLRALWRRIGLLNLFHFGWFSFFLFSHKVVRFLVPVLLTASVASLVWLVGLISPSPLVAVAAVAVIALLVHLGASGSSAGSWPIIGRPLRMFGIAMTMHAAALHGWWHFLSGRRDVVWQHDRSGA